MKGIPFRRRNPSPEDTSPASPEQNEQNNLEQLRGALNKEIDALSKLLGATADELYRGEPIPFDLSLAERVKKELFTDRGVDIEKFLKRAKLPDSTYLACSLPLVVTFLQMISRSLERLERKANSPEQKAGQKVEQRQEQKDDGPCIVVAPSYRRCGKSTALIIMEALVEEGVLVFRNKRDEELGVEVHYLDAQSSVVSTSIEKGNLEEEVLLGRERRIIEYIERLLQDEKFIGLESEAWKQRYAPVKAFLSVYGIKFADFAELSPAARRSQLEEKRDLFKKKLEKRRQRMEDAAVHVFLIDEFPSWSRKGRLEKNIECIAEKYPNSVFLLVSGHSPEPEMNQTVFGLIAQTIQTFGETNVTITPFWPDAWGPTRVHLDTTTTLRDRFNIFPSLKREEQEAEKREGDFDERLKEAEEILSIFVYLAALGNPYVCHEWVTKLAEKLSFFEEKIRSELLIILGDALVNPALMVPVSTKNTPLGPVFIKIQEILNNPPLQYQEFDIIREYHNYEESLTRLLSELENTFNLLFEQAFFSNVPQVVLDFKERRRTSLLLKLVAGRLRVGDNFADLVEALSVDNFCAGSIPPRRELVELGIPEELVILPKEVYWL